MGLATERHGFSHWPLDMKADSLEKILMLGKMEEMSTTEDEMVGWNHQFNGQYFEQTLGDSEGQGNLMCCSPWDHKDSDTT